MCPFEQLYHTPCAAYSPIQIKASSQVITIWQTGADLGLIRRENEIKITVNSHERSSCSRNMRVYSPDWIFYLFLNTACICILFGSVFLAAKPTLHLCCLPLSIHKQPRVALFCRHQRNNTNNQVTRVSLEICSSKAHKNKKNKKATTQTPTTGCIFEIPNLFCFTGIALSHTFKIHPDLIYV